MIFTSGCDAKRCTMARVRSVLLLSTMMTSFGILSVLASNASRTSPTYVSSLKHGKMIESFSSVDRARRRNVAACAPVRIGTTAAECESAWATAVSRAFFGSRLST